MFVAIASASCERLRLLRGSFSRIAAADAVSSCTNPAFRHSEGISISQRSFPVVRIDSTSGFATARSSASCAIVRTYASRPSRTFIAFAFLFVTALRLLEAPADELRGVLRARVELHGDFRNAVSLQIAQAQRDLTFRGHAGKRFAGRKLIRQALFRARMPRIRSL